MKKQTTQTGPVSLTPAERLSNRLGRVLKRLMKTHKEDTTIALDEFINEVPKVEIGSIVDFLTKEARKVGEIIEGRRGHPTRFVFGESWSKWIDSMNYRRQWRKDNGRDPETGRLLRRPYARAGSVRRANTSHNTMQNITATRRGNKVIIQVPEGVQVVTR